MNKTISLLVILIFVGFSSMSLAEDSAPCAGRLNSIVRWTKKQAIKVNQHSYSLTKQALRHYRGELGPTSPVHIERFFLYVTQYQDEVGYQADLTDGSSEGLVSYYFDQNSKLIYAYWHNQSPLEFWFCEQ